MVNKFFSEPSFNSQTRKKRLDFRWPLHYKLLLAALLTINLAVRLVIYHYTVLFKFSDYSSYLSVVDSIAEGEKVSLLSGNFLFAISYVGYFAKYVLGSLDVFFVLNCLLGTFTSLILFVLFKRLTASALPGLITVVIHTVYTEFIVFSSVFYTPVLMIFILALFLLLMYLYYSATDNKRMVLYAILLALLLVVSFFSKLELVFFPAFLIVLSLFFVKKDKGFALKTIILAASLLAGTLLFNASGILNHPEDDIFSNDFIFFGHTDYGGDGGEGSFVYAYNKNRYYGRLAEYCEKNSISELNKKEINRFQWEEIKKFITGSPHKWIGLQFTKFFRTFGVVPETTSFEILHTGLFKKHLWLTAIIVVAPVALIIILFILFFSLSSLEHLNSSTSDNYLNRSIDFSTSRQINTSTLQSENLQTRKPDKSYFLFVSLLLFVYYIIATVFFGHYQERYRMPVMVVFIIPLLGYFVANFDKKRFFNRKSLIIKAAIIALFLIIWVDQAKNAIANKERLRNAIESVEKAIRGKD